jgi:hypothetical protein
MHSLRFQGGGGWGVCMSQVWMGTFCSPCSVAPMKWWASSSVGTTTTAVALQQITARKATVAATQFAAIAAIICTSTIF